MLLLLVNFYLSMAEQGRYHQHTASIAQCLQEAPGSSAERPCARLWVWQELLIALMGYLKCMRALPHNLSLMVCPLVLQRLSLEESAAKLKDYC